MPPAFAILKFGSMFSKQKSTSETPVLEEGEVLRSYWEAGVFDLLRRKSSEVANIAVASGIAKAFRMAFSRDT